MSGCDSTCFIVYSGLSHLNDFGSLLREGEGGKEGLGMSVGANGVVLNFVVENAILFLL